MTPVSDDLPVLTIAVDPGGVTGVAWLANGEPSTFMSTQIEGGRDGFADWFRMVIAEGFTIDTVFCEDFIITSATARKTPQPDPYRIIGWLEQECRFLGIRFVLQTPSTGKSFGTDGKLKYVGWFRRGTGHANDAARHLLTGMRDTAHVRPLLLEFAASDE